MNLTLFTLTSMPDSTGIDLIATFRSVILSIDEMVYNGSSWRL